MARFIYGGGGDGDIIRTTGVPYINASANVYDARTGGNPVTDLQNITGAAITSVTTDSFGQAIFFGPDNYISVLWLDFGSGVRWALSPKAVDLTATRAITVQRAADAAGASLTTKAALPYHAADPLEQALATKLDPLVIPRFASQAARDAAFPSPVTGDRCWRDDLQADQVYVTALAAWRTILFANRLGPTGAGSGSVSNTATETQLAGINCPGTVTAGATFRVTAYGTAIQAASTTPTLRFRLRVGGVSGVLLATNSYTAVTNASPTARPWQVTGHITVMSVGASGTWFGNLRSSSVFTSTTAADSTQPAVRVDGTATGTRDTTTTQTLALTAQWDVASASNVCTLYGWNWERIN